MKDTVSQNTAPLAGEIKALPAEFEKLGFTFQQIDRKGRIAIFERFKGTLPHHFEVVIITDGKAYEIAGNKIPAAELYPSSEQWGKKGWTYAEKQDAMDKFNALVEASVLGPNPTPTATRRLFAQKERQHDH